MSVLRVGGLLVISGKEWTRRLSVGVVQFFQSGLGSWHLGVQGAERPGVSI